MKNTTILLSVFLLAFLSTGVIAQKLRNKFKDKQKEDDSKSVKLNELNEWHNAHAGQVVFYEKSIQYKSSSSSDSEYNSISERAIGASKPFGFRAYLAKPYNSGSAECTNIEIKYSIGDVSLTTSQLREELPKYYARMASALSFYDNTNYAVGVPLNAAPGKYYDNYTLQEDTYRILLSRVKDKLTDGATVNLKVEIFGINDAGVIKTEALAS